MKLFFKPKKKSRNTKEFLNVIMINLFLFIAVFSYRHLTERSLSESLVLCLNKVKVKFIVTLP